MGKKRANKFQKENMSNEISIKFYSQSFYEILKNTVMLLQKRANTFKKRENTSDEIFFCIV